MNATEIRDLLNELVDVQIKGHWVSGRYRLTAAIFRKAENGRFFYQIEVQDVKQLNSVVMVRLQDVRRAKNEVSDGEQV
jgi:hypothetical protein